ncbi:sigma-70 family RNA polymerase sigma factor [Luteolibacter pohnpeiensis]|uniref:Sigma-70 family RNA polymerase sigma factor n=1 Tax=Luteolibacter pohnpeiensis TaxID=454153 RepID=A0A934S7U1_9BACT|nr:sigma-70 family RNA polymerase sigma factor [Luteolibacter pohnpeiensis]MBK1882809.1 sigma-70 family RNA polymerase sigma factor [Luteolibacter pohnpeiensis]
MTDFAPTPFESGNSFPLANKLLQMSQGPPTNARSALSQPAPEAFTALWAEAQLSVRAFLTSYLSDRSVVDDCIQEVALLAWKKGPQDSTPEAFLGFCIACAKRIAMGEVRKKYRSKLRLLDPEIISSLADTVVSQELQETTPPVERLSALRRCMDKLGPEPRRLLETRYFSKDPTALKRIAESGGKSMDAIYKKLERLRSRLRDCVDAKSSQSE